MKELKYLNIYFIKYRMLFASGILITIIARIFALYTPKLVSGSMKTIEDYSNNLLSISQVKENLLENILYILLATILAGIFTFLMRQSLIVMSRHIEYDLKNKIYSHYQALSQSFFKQNRTGDLMNRISEDVAKVRMYTGPALMYGINTSITFIVVITQMYLISPKLTLYTLLPLPLLSYAIFKLSNAINKRSTIYQQNLSALASYSQEMFSGVRIIKAHAIEPEMQQGFEALSEDSKKKNLKLSFLNALFSPLMAVLIGLSNLTVILVGGMMYINGGISHVGLIAEFILYVNMLIWPVTSLGWISSMIQEAEASQKRINKFLRVIPNIQSQSDISKTLKGDITFKNVSFTYEDTHIQALKDICLEVKSGETLAIFGKTGSGKSTLLALLSRLYDIESGQLLIDGEPIHSISLKSLRSAIAVVPQDAFLFSETIRDNIRFGKEDASEQQVIEAAQKAAVHENIQNFRMGYDTVLGERGITLSGGQKQRVSIARALLKDAPILLLDDSLSAVDTETEELILQNLAKETRSKTTFIVSHRVSVARNADKIIVLDQGRIIQQGTHEELITQEGFYKDLYEKQLSDLT